MRARRLFLVLACSGLVAAVFAATSLGRSDKNGSTTAASGTVVLSGWGASPDELKLLKQVLRGFSKTYPNIHVDYQPITGDYVPAMLAKFAARKPADVFYVDSNVFLDWVTQGLLEPLDSYAQQSKFSSKPFYPSLLNGFKYKGKIYGYPKDWSPLAMEVNTDLAAKAGVKPASITNWATLTAAARKLRGAVPERDARSVRLDEPAGHAADELQREAFALAQRLGRNDAELRLRVALPHVDRETLDDDGRLARARPPDDQQRPRRVRDGPRLLGTEARHGS